MPISTVSGAVVASVEHYQQASSIFREVISGPEARHAPGTRGATDDLHHTANDIVRVGPIVGMVMACIVGAILLGIIVDFVVRHISSDDSEPTEEADSTGDSRADSPSQLTPAVESYHRSSSNVSRDGSVGSDGLDPAKRGSSYYFDREKGIWSMRGLSSKGGASSVGHPLYSVVEEGCASINLRKKSSAKIEEEPKVEHWDLGSTRSTPWFEGSS